MKTILTKTLLIASSLFLGSILYAQAPGVPDSAALANAPQRGIRTPENIMNLEMQGKYSEAIAAFEKFKKKSSKADPCHMLYLEATFYLRLKDSDHSNSAAHSSKIGEVIKTLDNTCPNMADMYMLKTLVSGDGYPDSVVNWMNAAIKLDSKNGAFYCARGENLWLLNKEKEACADFKKGAELNDEASRVAFTAKCRSIATEPIPAK